jgi:large subunit ribosomal protein L18
VSLLKRIIKRIIRRTHRVRNAQLSRGVKPRIAVFRSSKHIYAQIIDDSKQVTLVGLSTLNLKDASGDKKARAKRVGLELGKLAVERR